MAGFGLSSDVEQFEESFLVNFWSNFIGWLYLTNQRVVVIEKLMKSFPDSGIGYSWLKNYFFDGPRIFYKILIVFQFSFFVKMTPRI